MNRHNLLPAILAAAALTLSACGSTPGTPTAQDSSTVSSSTSSASESSAADDSVTESEDATDVETSDSTVVVGDGALDAQTAQWFTAACTGLQPMGEMVAAMVGVSMSMATATGTPAAGAPTPAEMQSQLATALSSAGASLSDSASGLKALPPPTFDKGDEMADAFIAFLNSTGPKLDEIGQQIASATVTDTASLGAAMAQLETLGQEDIGGADLLSEYGLDPATQKAVEELPACKAMQDSLGGMMGTGSAG